LSAAQEIHAGQTITWLLGIREADAYWAKPMTDARKIELWKILAEGCQKHPAYRAKRQVKIDCEPCSVMWKARVELEAVE
jgi:hypothetical protein